MKRVCCSYDFLIDWQFNFYFVFFLFIVGAEARQLFNDAQEMIKQLIKTGDLKANGIVGFFKANSINNDDIVLYDKNDKEIARLFCLRQQSAKDSHDNSPYMSLADFVAPKELNMMDYIGLFVVSAGFGCDELCKKYLTNNDVYNDILIKAIADRLAEAFAEHLHRKVRTELWAYQKEELLNVTDLLKVKYQGIRPAPGYPSQPDHTEKLTMWRLMDVEKQTGIKLTESLAIWPSASTCGIYFAHPDAKYFAVGKMQNDQITDYARRKNMPIDVVQKWLSAQLAFEP